MNTLALRWGCRRRGGTATIRRSLVFSALFACWVPTCLGGCSASGKASLSPQAANATGGVMGSTTGKGASTSLGKARLEPEACQGYDLTPERERLSVAALKQHLQEQSLPYEVKMERGDLHILEVEYQGRTTPLRVATLGDRHEAGRHLHEALLEHGSGYWGVHRGNLAVLGPPGSSAEAIGFAVDSGLACWGVLTLVGRDDSFVVPGGYVEL